MLRSGPMWQALIDEAFAPGAERLAVICSDALPHVPLALAEFRLTVLGRAGVVTLADLERFLAPWPDAEDPAAAAVQALIDCIAGGLDAPTVAASQPVAP
jgi:hypothetical protein